ncbi:MAG: PQQ-dependent sugar dehydrogenase [Cyclobacteriaceae bacterium]
MERIPRKSSLSCISFITVLTFLPLIFSCEKKTELVETGEGVKLKIELVADNISIPSGMAFLPNGKLLVTDRPKGELIIIDLKTGDKTAVSGVPPVTTQGDGGLHDILPHPDFEQNNRVFFVYSFKDENGFSLTVETATLKDNSLTQRKKIFAARPFYKVANFFGSKLALMDGYLFITTGVNKRMQDSAQLLNNHLGKIMRIREDGSIPDDNPFVNVPGALPDIWCYGTRNSQGMTINPYTNELWANEHGPKGGDEVNIIKAGKNYGWPIISYGLEYDGTPVGQGLREKEGMEQPIYHYTPSIAPSGMEFYTGDAFPMWKGNLFIGGMVLTHLNRLVIKDDKVVHEERLFQDKKWRVRSVRQGPDDFLYIGVDGGMILRIRPE